MQRDSVGLSCGCRVASARDEPIRGNMTRCHSRESRASDESRSEMMCSSALVMTEL
jgi:hypothetical protein